MCDMDIKGAVIGSGVTFAVIVGAVVAGSLANAQEQEPVTPASLVEIVETAEPTPSPTPEPVVVVTPEPVPAPPVEVVVPEPEPVVVPEPEPAAVAPEPVVSGAQATTVPVEPAPAVPEGAFPMLPGDPHSGGVSG